MAQTFYNTGVQGYDYTADPFYQQAKPETQDVMRRNAEWQVNQQNLTQAAQDWQTGRDPYYAALRQQYNAAQQPGIEQSYADALKHQQLQAAQMGQTGGSADMYAQTRLAGQKSQQMGAADLQAQQIVNAQKLQDQQVVNQWMMELNKMNPNAAYTQAKGQGIGMGQDLQNQWYRWLQQQQQSDQQYADATSQLYGSQLNSLANTIKGAGASAAMGGGGGK